MMDLTKHAPRSVKETVLGIVQLARTTDKAKAIVDGQIGEYHYDCPIDRALFDFLAMDPKEFLTPYRPRRTRRSKRMRSRLLPRRIGNPSKLSTRVGFPPYRPGNR